MLTDSDLLAAPGGAYAVLRRLRDRAAPWWNGRPLAAPADPWARPAWDVDTLYLPLINDNNCATVRHVSHLCGTIIPAVVVPGGPALAEILAVRADS